MADQTFDIIIAGGASIFTHLCSYYPAHRTLVTARQSCIGGTSGCVVAGRLAAADPTLSILVIEAGPPTRDDDLHTQPARYRYHLRPETTTIKFHTAHESAALGGRAPVVPCGQCVGGGSSVNCMCINFSCFLSTAA